MYMMMRCIVYNNKSQSKGITESHILTKAHETRTILSNVVTLEEVTKSMGCVALRMEYFLRTFPMTCTFNVYSNVSYVSSLLNSYTFQLLFPFCESWNFQT